MMNISGLYFLLHLYLNKISGKIPFVIEPVANVDGKRACGAGGDLAEREIE